jgi:hypothetical protein
VGGITGKLRCWTRTARISAPTLQLEAVWTATAWNARSTRGNSMVGHAWARVAHLWPHLFCRGPGDGTVAKIPYSDAPVPTFANSRAHAWPSLEYYGQVLVYFDVERRQPPYQPPAIPLIDTGSMVHRGTHR